MLFLRKKSKKRKTIRKKSQNRTKRENKPKRTIAFKSSPSLTLGLKMMIKKTAEKTKTLKKRTD